MIRNANDNPQPFVTGHSVEAAGEQWTLALSGEEFATGAKLLLNGNECTVTAVTTNLLLATLSTDDLVNGGLVQVSNPAPGGGLSNQWVMAPRQQQTIDFAAPDTQLLHNSPFDPVAVASSGLPVAFSSTTPAICTAEETDRGWNVTLVAIGSCTLIATQAGDGAFNPAPPVKRTFPVAAVGTVYLPLVLRAGNPAAQVAEAITLAEAATLQLPGVDAATTTAERNGVSLYLPLVAQ